jgi:hypothetical protein
MDGYLQTGIGILVSLILFIIGYRQTIGAKKERAKNANLSIHRAIMRRMVLEDYAPVYSDVGRIVEGKAREFLVSQNDLLSEEQVLNSLYTEVFDSDLISSVQRVEIEQRLVSCFEKIEKEPSKPSFEEFQQLNSERRKMKDNLAAMVISTSILGAMASVLFKFIETKTIQVEWLFSGLGVLVASIAILTSLTIYRKNKEIEVVPSRRSAQIVSSAFEAEIANTLKKNNFDFVIEPNLGNLRPDFLVKLGGKTIAIEAKAWQGPIPLHFVRQTLNYLNELIHSESIDKAILVTQKKTKFPLGALDSEKISVVSLSELSSELKKAA